MKNKKSKIVKTRDKDPGKVKWVRHTAEEIQPCGYVIMPEIELVFETNITSKPVKKNKPKKKRNGK